MLLSWEREDLEGAGAGRCWRGWEGRGAGAGRRDVLEVLRGAGNWEWELGGAAGPPGKLGLQATAGVRGERGNGRHEPALYYTLRYDVVML